MKWVAASLVLWMPVMAATGAPVADQSGYHLLQPTPRQLMRDLSADRPDVTESPYTVDAGHVQVELSFVEYRRDNEGEDEAEGLALLPVNFKIGLLNNVDVQLVAEPYLWADSDGEDGEGFGATALRLKVNLWGNDSGDSALAVMPFIAFPTADDDVGGEADRVEGGLIVPLAISLGERLGLGTMLEADLAWDGEDEDYDLDLVHSASLAVELSDRLGTFVEYVGVVNSDGGDYQAVVGVGLTYALGEDLQFDVGANVGVSDAADDLRFFSGLTLRI